MLILLLFFAIVTGVHSLSHLGLEHEYGYPFLSQRKVHVKNEYRNRL